MTPWRTGPRARGAFTLIEVMIAVAIMGVLAGAVAWSFTTPLHRARMTEAAEQVRYLDASTRDLARRFGRGTEIVFDVSDGTMRRRDRRSAEASFQAVIASPIRIEAVWTASRRAEGGEVVVPVSPLGIGPTYAVKLAGPAVRQWIVVSGLGGDVATLTDDAQVEAIFAKVSPGRDAD